MNRYLPASALLSCVCCVSVSAAIETDTFGYTSRDVPFSFIDLSDAGLGTPANFQGADDRAATVPLGFDFEFYGETYDSIGVSTNGLLTFGGATTEWVNTPLDDPSDLGTRPAIAPLWDDWQFFQSGAGGVHWDTLGVEGDRRFVAQWDTAYGYSSSPSDVTFQAVLYEASGDIRFNYLDVDSGNSRAFGDQATIGIRDGGAATDGRFVQVGYNTEAAVGNFESILFELLPADFEFGIGNNGDAFVSNLSPEGVLLESLEIDLSADPDGSFFDTDRMAPGVDWRGFTLDEQQGTFGVTLPSDSATDGATVARFDFTDFDPDELARIGFDLDLFGEEGIVIEGAAAPAGGFVTATFSNGRQITRELLESPLSVGGATFEASTRVQVAVPEPAALASLLVGFAVVCGRRRDD